MSLAAEDLLDDVSRLESGDPTGMLTAVASSAAQVGEAATLAGEAGVVSLAEHVDETGRVPHGALSISTRMP